MDVTEFGDVHDLTSGEVTCVDFRIYLNFAVFWDKFIGNLVDLAVSGP